MSMSILLILLLICSVTADQTASCVFSMPELRPKPYYVYGQITFTATSDLQSTIVNGIIHGLEPNSNFGFHIHTYGDLRGPYGVNVGPHFNPFNGTHSCDVTSLNKEVGDMGNIRSNDSGTAFVNKTLYGVLLQGQNSIVGRSVVIHNSQDPCTPGNFGIKIGQCVIGVEDNSEAFFSYDNPFTSDPVVAVCRLFSDALPVVLFTQVSSNELLLNPLYEDLDYKRELQQDNFTLNGVTKELSATNFTANVFSMWSRSTSIVGKRMCVTLHDDNPTCCVIGLANPTSVASTTTSSLVSTTGIDMLQPPRVLHSKDNSVGIIVGIVMSAIVLLGLSYYFCANRNNSPQRRTLGA